MALVASRSVFVYVACSGLEESRELARVLLSEGCALCVSVIGGVESHYRWRGALHCESEALLWIKVRDDLVERAVALLQERHSYDLPAISVLRVEAVPEEVAAWIGAMGEKEGEQRGGTSKGGDDKGADDKGDKQNENEAEVL